MNLVKKFDKPIHYRGPMKYLRSVPSNLSVNIDLQKLK